MEGSPGFIKSSEAVRLNRQRQGRLLCTLSFDVVNHITLTHYEYKALVFHTGKKTNIPICLLVISTVAFRLTLESKPKQNLSEFDGSVKPSTVSEGCDAWKVSPTLWFNS